MKFSEFLKKPGFVATAILLVVALLLGFFIYRTTTIGGPSQTSTPTPISTIQESPTPPPATPTATLTSLPPQDPAEILGIDSTPDISLPGIKWIRLSYPTCGWGNLRGDVLRNVIETYHQKNIRIMLVLCQPGNDDAKLYDNNLFADAAQGNADAVQCGNEQMKQDASVAFLYISPEKFARFYSMCEKAIHAVRSDVPVLMGSLDPHVSGPDYNLLVGQADYLDTMQDTMNRTVRPGENWNWHDQRIGLIDSWHNGYPSADVNNMQGLFSFWAEQFHVDLNSGQLGQHLWVSEATGCFRGCGVPDSAYAISVSHILALIVDAQTATQYKVPMFYFSSKDFQDQGITWPIGVLDMAGHPKPIRQDLPMGAKVFKMSCGGQATDVQDQLQLLSKLYDRCSLPGNWRDIITG